VWGVRIQQQVQFEGAERQLGGHEGVDGVDDIAAIFDCGWGVMEIRSVCLH